MMIRDETLLLCCELCRCFKFIRMSSEAFVFVVTTTLDVCEAFALDFSSIETDLCSQFDLVLLTEICSDDMVDKVRTVLE